MIGIASVAEIAALIGDPARASMLYALKDDGRISAGDLSVIARVAPSTASEHLAKLAEAGLVRMTRQGRMRYYRLSDSTVAEVLEGVESLAASLSQHPPTLRWDHARVHARSCLDHIGGELGGRLAGAAAERGLVSHSSEGLGLTEAGARWLVSLGVDVDALRDGPRRFLGLCHDWTFELPHLGGAVGGAVMRALVANDWLRHERRSGLVVVTPKGVAGLRSQFGLDARAVSGVPATAGTGSD